MASNSKDSRQRYNLLSAYDPNEYQGRDAGESSPSYRQNAVGRYVKVPEQQKQAAAPAAPAQPKFGLEATQENWLDSAGHLVKDYGQRNTNLSDEEKTLDYWKKRAGVNDINKQSDIAQLERTMRNREHELSNQRSQQAAAPAAPEAKPFNPADYAPKPAATTETAAAPAAKKPGDYLTQTLEGLKSNTQGGAYESFQASLRSRDEKVASGQIDPLTPANLQNSPNAQTGQGSSAKWAEYAAAFGYGPNGHRIDPTRKASSSRFLDQLKTASS
jgi:hypothetical protein